MANSLNALKVQGAEEKTRILAVAVAVILAAGFVSYYVYASNEMSSLKTAGQGVCHQEEGIYNRTTAIIANETNALQGQIRVDTGMIHLLSAVQPAGYSQMITELNSDIYSANYILTLANSSATALTSLSPTGPLAYPCAVLTG
jgi:hypothetical protein